MYSLFAFDNYFAGADRAYSLEEQSDILRDIGYDKLYFSVGLTNAEAWENMKRLGAERKRTGFGLAALYTVVDLDNAGKPPAAVAHAVEELVELLEPGETLELAIMAGGWKANCSDPARDERAVALLRPLLARVRERGATLALYPHLGFWQERVEDCVRVAQKVDDPTLGVSFSGYHWFAVDGADLPGKLRLAAPWLKLVSVCGARRVSAPRLFGGSLPATIEPVGEGDFPLVELVRGMREIGYTGSVGFQGYKIGGYPPLNLRRSLEAFRRAERSA